MTPLSNLDPLDILLSLSCLTCPLRSRLCKFYISLRVLPCHHIISASKRRDPIPCSWLPLSARGFPSLLLHRIRFIYAPHLSCLDPGPTAGFYFQCLIPIVFSSGVFLIDFTSRVQHQEITLLHVFRKTPVFCGWVIGLNFFRVRSSAITESAKSSTSDAIPLS